MKNKIKIAILDDHQIVCDGMRALIECESDMQVCRTLPTVAMLWAYLEDAECPHLLIVDLNLQGCSGLDVIKDMRKHYPRVNLLVVSMHEELTYIERALRAGAKGYVAKHEASEVLIDAIRKIMADEIFISPKLLPDALRLLSGRQPAGDNEDPVACLSNRELEVLQYIAAGRGTREIAKLMNLSVNTIATHRRHIREKLCLSNADVIRFAVEWGLNNNVAV